MNINQEQLIVKTALKSWDTTIGRISQLLENLSEEQLTKEIAPDKNRGIYIIGHLLATHDALNEILGIGERARRDLDGAFVQNSDNPKSQAISVSTLKTHWNDVHQNLSNRFQEMPAGAWLQRHEAMTDEDFTTDPARNKLAVLMNRTNHAT